MHAATIVSHHYLAHARTTARSFLEHNPEARFTAVVVGDPAGGLHEGPFEVISEHDLGLSDLATRRRIYDDFEYALSFKPTVLRWLLNQDELAVYLDADFYVVDSFDDLKRQLADSDMLLTPHLLRTLPDDGFEPSMPSILRAGLFNAGFVAARRGAGAAGGVLDWWEQRLITGCKVDVPRGYFVDQRWLDLAALLFDGIAVSRDAGWNVGHWTLARATVARAGLGWSVDDGPLRAFHFSGFNPDTPEILSKYQNRITVDAGSPLAALCAEYAAALKDNGYDELAGGGRNTYYGRDFQQRLLGWKRRAALVRARLAAR